MRTCPKCKKELVTDDGYCAGWCREMVMMPLRVKATPAVAGAAICYAPPRFRWEQCYELDNRVHWALCDTQTDADAPPHRVSCLEMILWDHHSPDLPNQLMPKLIVELLNAHYANYTTDICLFSKKLFSK